MASPLTHSHWLDTITRLMEGAPRRHHAAAFPPDRFWCRLDDLPWHLIPRRDSALLHAVSDTSDGFHLNPCVTVFADGQIPCEIGPDLIRDFAFEGAVAWVRDLETRTALPFWLGPRLQTTTEYIHSAGRVPSQISDYDLAVLQASEILVNAHSLEQSEETLRNRIDRARTLFKKHDYAPIRGLIHPFHVAALRRYYRWRIRRGLLRLGDDQVNRRYFSHNDSVLRFFHRQIAARVAAVVGQAVKPSYVYLASYLEGAELVKHTDRAQCEFSVTLCLDYSPEPERETPWPIRLETRESDVAVYQAIGDALVYRGTRVPHCRTTLPRGHSSTSVFFHYVPVDFRGSLD